MLAAVELEERPVGAGVFHGAGRAVGGDGAVFSLSAAPLLLHPDDRFSAPVAPVRNGGGV